MDDQLIIEIWETFKDFIPEKTRDAAAIQFVDFLQSRDIDDDTLKSLLGYDSSLDNAVELIQIEEDQEEEFDEDWDYSEDDDEE